MKVPVVLSLLSLSLFAACGPAPGGTTPAGNPSSAPSPGSATPSPGSSIPSTSVQVTRVSGCAAPAGNLVSNGDFEDPGVGTAWRAFSGNDSLPGWDIPTGNIELVGSTFKAVSGVQSLDLDGTAPGALSQTLATQAGKAYVLSFCLAGNPAGLPKVKDLDVLWNGTAIASLKFDTTNTSLQSMGWQGYRIEIPAAMTSGPASLGFRSKTEGGGGAYYGPALDSIGVGPR